MPTAKNQINGTVYWNESFWGVNNRGYDPAVQFDTPPLTRYTVLWQADGVDNIESPEEAVGIAMRMFAAENAYAEVRISTAGYNIEVGTDNECDDVLVFAITSTAKAMSKLLKTAKTERESYGHSIPLD